MIVNEFDGRAKVPKFHRFQVALRVEGLDVPTPPAGLHMPCLHTASPIQVAHVPPLQEGSSYFAQVSRFPLAPWLGFCYE